MKRIVSKREPPRITVHAHGLEWDNAKINVICEHQGYKWIEVKTEKQLLTIRITPTGLIRTNIEKREKDRDNSEYQR